MTGPEHYKEAERLLAGAQNVMDVAPVDGLTRVECVELAQVHATLALAAASAQNIRRNGAVDVDADWTRVLGGAEHGSRCCAPEQFAGRVHPDCPGGE